MLKPTYINPYGFALSAVCLTVSFPIFADTDINVLNNLEVKRQDISVPLANDFYEGADIEQYWYSEKLDGIRAFWNGEQLFTRTGKPIIAPEWFTQGLPKEKLDGELWAGRGHFSQVQRTVLDQKPDEDDWKNIQYMAFDLVESGTYDQRYQHLQRIVSRSNNQYLALVKQSPIDSTAFLYQNLQSVETKMGEGIMLRKIKSHYQGGRTDDLLKLKSFQDDEATVIGYKPGKGKNLNRTGSLYVEWKDGKRFYIGSGLTNELRNTPPALGEKVTFRFNGYTRSGLPRFARFIHVRSESL
ncbi:DNA ligase [Vibrio hibernica]|uniref:DNA ligase n=1 Tax=Vibrio hibernica TaxID=2587465 RepID=UPI001880181E|nr:DNA ligase [Vibrio hibernica]